MTQISILKKKVKNTLNIPFQRINSCCIYIAIFQAYVCVYIYIMYLNLSQ